MFLFFLYIYNFKCIFLFILILFFLLQTKLEGNGMTCLRLVHFEKDVSSQLFQEEIVSHAVLFILN